MAPEQEAQNEGDAEVKSAGCQTKSTGADRLHKTRSVYMLAARRNTELTRQLT
jgi:hypothetical protein